MDYQAAKDLINLGIRMDALEIKVAQMGAATESALAELRGAVDEVASELEALAAQVESADLDASLKIREQATRLRGLRNDEPAPTDETPTV